VEFNTATAAATNIVNNHDAVGGGLYVGSGTVSLSSTFVEYNSATAPAAIGDYHLPAGSAYGAGIAVLGGTVTLSGDFIEYNTATGGANSTGYPAGSAFGGLYVGAGTVTLCNDTVEFNTATPGTASNGSPDGLAVGGIFIASGATVYIDLSTIVTNNSPNNIVGTYISQNC
jgi:hypothetical protein